MDVSKKSRAITNKNAMVGKKRKKKNTKKDEEKSMKGHSTHATVSTTTKTIVRKDSVIPLASALSIRKIEEHCSSSSSIENHKPIQKLGRFEETSSDGMSIGTDTLSPPTVIINDISMDSGTDSCTSQSSMNKKTIATTESDQHVETSKTGLTTRKLSIETLASLRWENRLEDEKAEERRIEEYKNERRLRYQNELGQRREEIASRSTSKRNTYYYHNITTIKS